MTCHVTVITLESLRQIFPLVTKEHLTVVSNIYLSICLTYGLQKQKEMLSGSFHFRGKFNRTAYEQDSLHVPETEIVS